MAGKDDRDEGMRRRREREDEAEEEARRAKERDSNAGSGESAARGALEGDSAALDRLIQEVGIQIERVHSLYLQFLSGIERLPPHEARTRLESLVAKLEQAPKPNPAYRFRAVTMMTRFQSYRDRWEKSLKDLESGKIKRSVGPKGR